VTFGRTISPRLLSAGRTGGRRFFTQLDPFTVQQNAEFVLRYFRANLWRKLDHLYFAAGVAAKPMRLPNCMEIRLRLHVGTAKPLLAFGKVAVCEAQIPDAHSSVSPLGC
jgi:hypothetical protein